MFPRPFPCQGHIPQPLMPEQAGRGGCISSGTRRAGQMGSRLSNTKGWYMAFLSGAGERWKTQAPSHAYRSFIATRRVLRPHMCPPITALPPSFDGNISPTRALQASSSPILSLARRACFGPAATSRRRRGLSAHTHDYPCSHCFRVVRCRGRSGLCRDAGLMTCVVGLLVRSRHEPCAGLFRREEGFPMRV